MLAMHHHTIRKTLLVASALAFITIPTLATASDGIEPEADASGVLDAYMNREQPAYGWTYEGSQQLIANATLHKLTLTSQTWMGIEWKHPLNIVVPAAEKSEGENARPGHCILVITSGDEETHAQVCAMLTARVGVPIAILHQVPNQPLLAEQAGNGRGLWEDALIAQTFLEFSKSGNPDWPLLLPMTRSVVSAMDAVGEFSKQMMQEQPDTWKWEALEKFVTTGASKRGWTTWLSAVADDRVIAIAPMVYDTLNLPRQIPLHYETWGEPSPSIHDYTERGLLEMLKDHRGRQLMQIVDPYSYIKRITVPKLILLGTNDPYWPLAAIHEYIDALPGETYCHYVPNAGHALGANMSVLFSISGFFDAVTGRTSELPQTTLTLNGKTGSILIEHEDVASIESVALLQTQASTGRDFRSSHWHRIPLTSENGAGGIWQFDIPEAMRNGGPSSAFIAEVTLSDHAGNSFSIHTPVKITD